jgi:hypothetical protein
MLNFFFLSSQAIISSKFTSLRIQSFGLEVAMVSLTGVVFVGVVLEDTEVGVEFSITVTGSFFISSTLGVVGVVFTDGFGGSETTVFDATFTSSFLFSVKIGEIFFPATLSKYTRGFTVYSFALSLQSQRFTQSEKVTPAALASAQVYGQYE